MAGSCRLVHVPEKVARFTEQRRVVSCALEESQVKLCCPLPWRSFNLNPAQLLPHPQISGVDPEGRRECRRLDGKPLCVATSEGVGSEQKACFPCPRPPRVKDAWRGSTGGR